MPYIYVCVTFAYPKLCRFNRLIMGAHFSASKIVGWKFISPALGAQFVDISPSSFTRLWMYFFSLLLGKHKVYNDLERCCHHISSLVFLAIHIPSHINPCSVYQNFPMYTCISWILIDTKKAVCFSYLYISYDIKRKQIGRFSSTLSNNPGPCICIRPYKVLIT